MRARSREDVVDEQRPPRCRQLRTVYEISIFARVGISSRTSDRYACSGIDLQQGWQLSEDPRTGLDMLK